MTVFILGWSIHLKATRLWFPSISSFNLTWNISSGWIESGCCFFLPNAVMRHAGFSGMKKIQGLNKKKCKCRRKHTGWSSGGRGKQLASQPSLLTEWLTTCKTVITDKQQSTGEIPSCHHMQGEIGWEDHQVSSFSFFPPIIFHWIFMSRKAIRDAHNPTASGNV